LKKGIIGALIAILVLSSVSVFASSSEATERKIVVFKSSVDMARKEEIIKKHGGVKIKDLDCINAVAVNLPKNSKLKYLEDVLYMEADNIVNVNAKKVKPIPTHSASEVIPWGIEYMGATSMWNNETDNIKVGKYYQLLDHQNIHQQKKQLKLH